MLTANSRCSMRFLCLPCQGAPIVGANPTGNSRSSREAPGADQEGYEWSEAPREKVPVWGSAGYTGRSTGEHQCGIENTNVRAYPPVEIALALADPLPADRRLQGRSRLWEILGCVSVTGLLPPPCRQPVGCAAPPSDRRLSRPRQQIVRRAPRSARTSARRPRALARTRLAARTRANGG